jgi:rubrerythrin
MNNSEKIAAAAAKRKAKMSNVKASAASSGWVKDRVTKKGHPLIRELQQYYIDAIGERNKGRDTAHIHPSEMAKANWCQRQTAYRIGFTPKDPGFEPSRLYWRLASIFEEGHDIHEKHQSALWEMGVLEGVWLCNACEHTWWGISPVVCESCGSVHIEYAEVPIEHPEYHIIGHTDGIHAEDNDRRNLEVKSVGIRSIEIEIPGVYQRWKESGADLNALWASIKIPFPSHQRQVQIYMAAMRSMGYDISETWFVYEFKATQDLKGFTVKFNERAAQSLLDKATEVLEAVDTPEQLPRPKWATTKAADCKECAYHDRCWSRP